MDDSAAAPAPPATDGAFVLAPVRRHVPLLTAGLVLLAVLVTWLFGHLPWVLDGFRTPREADVAGSASEGLSQVRLAVPLVASQITALVAFTAIGSVTASLLPLAFTELPRAYAVVVTALVVALTNLVLALAARASITDASAGGWAGDDRVLDGLVVGVLLVGACAGLLGCLAAFRIGFLPLAVAVIVGVLPTWIGLLGGGDGLHDAAYRAASLVLLGAAFAISVRRSAWWALLWPVALAIVWTATPLRVATGVLQDRLRPGAGLTEDRLGDVLHHAGEVFRASFWDAPRTWWPGVVAALVVLVWVLVRNRRSGATRPVA